MKKPITFPLPNAGSVQVHDRQGRTLVSFRQNNDLDGKELHSINGISLTTREWSVLRGSVSAIDEVLLQKRRKNQRFDGENYHGWASQMKSLLQLIEIDYVLSDLGPESSSRYAAQSKAAEDNRTGDDHACHHIILNSLCDSIFQQYSERTMSARELWDELSIPFQHSTKRSLVKKYEEFKMVEEKPVSKQVEELDNIAKSIISAGMPIDQEFHQSFIISKLPQSLRDVKMHEEHLTSAELVDQLRVKEHTAGASRGKRTNHKSKLAPKTSKIGQPNSSLPLKKRKRPMDVV